MENTVRVKDLVSVTTPPPQDFLVLDGDSGTKRITVENFLSGTETIGILNYKGTAAFTDFDDQPANTVYWVNPTVTTGHNPSTTYGIVERFGSLQRFTEYDKTRNVYTRIYANGAWPTWRMQSGVLVLTDEDLNSLFSDAYLNCFFTAAGGNTCANTPDGWTAFGGITCRYGAGSYTQFAWNTDSVKIRTSSGGIASNWKDL